MKNKKKTMEKALELVRSYTDETTNKIDPFGSYTGKCEDPYEQPVQDADDL